MKKKLTRSSTDKKISGVCAGFAEYFEIDPTIVRVIYAVLSLFTSGFPGLILYIVLMIIMPEDDGMINVEAEDKTDENN